MTDQKMWLDQLYLAHDKNGKLTCRIFHLYCTHSTGQDLALYNFSGAFLMASQSHANIMSMSYHTIDKGNADIPYLT